MESTSKKRSLILVAFRHFETIKMSYEKNLGLNGLKMHNKSLKFVPGLLRIPANVTGHSGDRDRFAHGHHTGVGFVL